MIYTTLTPGDPQRAAILPAVLGDQQPDRISSARHQCEMLVHPDETLHTTNTDQQEASAVAELDLHDA